MEVSDLASMKVWGNWPDPLLGNPSTPRVKGMETEQPSSPLHGLPLLGVRHIAGTVASCRATACAVPVLWIEKTSVSTPSICYFARALNPLKRNTKQNKKELNMKYIGSEGSSMERMLFRH